MSTPTPDDGGPAFPQTETKLQNRCIPGTDAMELIPCTVSYGGMSIRDWFAGQALHSGLIDSCAPNDKVAEYAYQLADAMLAARKEKQ